MKLGEQLGSLGLKAGTTILGWIVSLVVMVVVLVVGNFLLVGGQHLWHREDYAKLDSIKADMEQRKSVISGQESELTTKGAEIDQQKQELESKKQQLAALKEKLTSLRNSIKHTEEANPDGIPSELFDQYKSDIAEYNRLVRTSNQLASSYNNERESFNTLVNEYNSEHEVYSKQIDSYNAQVSEANAVSKRIGGTMVMVPGLGRRSRSRHVSH